MCIDNFWVGHVAHSTSSAHPLLTLLPARFRAPQASSQAAMVKALCVGNVYCGKTSLVKRYTRNTFSHGYTTSIGVDFMLKNLTIDGQAVKIQVWDVGTLQKHTITLILLFYAVFIPSMCSLGAQSAPLLGHHSFACAHPDLLSLSLLAFPCPPTAGQDRFAGLSRAFYMFSNGAIVVFDLGDRASFEAAARWKRDIDDKIELRNGLKVPVLLLGNKCDLYKDAGAGGDQPCVTEAQIQAFVKEHNFFKYYPVSALDGTNVAMAVDDLVREIVRRTQLPADPASGAADSMTAERYHNPTGESKGVPVKAESEQSGGCC